MPWNSPSSVALPTSILGRYAKLMNENYRYKQASNQELTLYCIAGEALCAVQHVEEPLSHSIVIKKIRPELKKEADNLLDKHRSYTLGKAIEIARQECLCPESLQQELDDFLSKRNWLIHKSIAQNRREWDLNVSRDKLMSRIKAITKQAHNLQRLIEEDLIKFADDNGVDMSRARVEINKFYSE
jgi:hypothetical protein